MTTRIKIISVMLAVCLLSAPAYAEIPQAYGDEDEIWSCLAELCPNEKIAAGIMGFMFRESRLKADAVAGWDVRPEGTCEAFVRAVDNGMEKSKFIRQVQNYGGFGLGQWVSTKYLSDLYEYITENDYSIADIRGQCEFAIWSIQKCDDLWSELQVGCTTAIQCGRRIGLLYDGTSAEGAEAIAGFAQYYYERMVSE